MDRKSYHYQMINQRPFILILGFWLAASAAWCQYAGVSQLNSVAAKVIHTIRSVKEERAYIKTDKSFYSPGDKIWFRSFLVNVHSGKLTSATTMLFVDLVNEKDSVVTKALLQASMYKTDGNLVLSDTIQTGFYWIRAYNKNIALHHPENMAIQPVYVFNAIKPAVLANNNTVQSITETINNTGKFYMDFFPEGGSVVGGAQTVIAFKITDEKGTARQLSGFVKDDLDSVVASFHSNKYGLGKLSFLAWSWRKYEAHLVTDDKQEKLFALPKVDLFAAQLAVVEGKNIKKIRIILEDSIYKKDMRTYIIGLAGDSLCFAGIGTGSCEVIVPEYRFPGGVADFLLFDEQQHLLSERKLFIQSNKLNVELTTDKPQYRARQKVQLNISVADGENHPVISSMFVKISDSAVAGNINLLSNVNQQVEALPGINEWTLMNQPMDEDELELLMLTQKSSFKELLKTGATANKKELVDAADSSFYIKGRIRGGKGNLLKNRTVTLFSGNKNILVLVDTTNANGEFRFPLLSYYDQTKFNLQITDKRGIPEDAKIELDTLLHFPCVVTPAFLKQKIPVEGVKEFYTAQRKRSVLDTIMMGNGWLKEVIVRSTIKKPAEYNRDKRVSSFSRILTGKMLQNGGNNNVGDALFRIPGITIRNGYVVIRGGNGFRPPSPADEPLIILDGMAVSTPSTGDLVITSPLLQFFATLDFRIIDFIEVLMGADAAFYGSRGFNGVIIIHTKKSQTEIGDPLPLGIQTITMPGYQVPVTFEQPDYSSKEIRNDKFPDRRTLIYWNGDVITDEKGKVSIDFYTADVPTRYYVNITGISADGRLVNKQILLKNSVYR